MRKATPLAFLLISTYPLLVSAVFGIPWPWHGSSPTYKLSTPEECARVCRDNEPPLTCYQKWRIEHYTTVNPACDYNETAAECVLADGVEKGILTANRQIPSPAIEICRNDRVVIDVDNSASGIGVTIHWHGLFQAGSQYYDGVPYVTQCPIQESNTFRYMFVGANSGTHMQHAHTFVHMIDGLYGAVIVRDPPSTEPHYGLYDEERLVVVTDLFHDATVEHFPGKFRNPVGQTPDNFLINGKGQWTDPTTNVATSTRVESFSVQYGKRYRFRMMNIGSTVCLSVLSIMHHKLTVIATDGAPVKPVEVDFITSATGERVDFIVNAKNKPGRYWITLRGTGECKEKKVYQLATLDYEGASTMVDPKPSSYDDIPTTGVTFNPEDVSGCKNNSKDVVCVYQLKSVEKPPSGLLKPTPDYRIILPFGFETLDNRIAFRNGTYEQYFIAPGGTGLSSTVKNISFIDPPAPPLSQREGYETPVRTQCPDGSYCTGRQIYSVPTDSIVEIALFDDYKIANLTHPFHLHGHEFSVLDQGYVESVTKQDILEVVRANENKLRSGEIRNPPKKDTVVVPNGGYTIIRFKANNPGYWLFHCHFTFHAISGMEVIMHVGSRSELPPVPPGFPKCGNFLPPLSFPQT